ncbi:hypothetical protein LBMAG56_10360 [Verrucomicrobiota bacterium]|nr:hypothetical protein LBMAG56_10360 [Verrucomicrobiota bacterium]
MVSGRGSVSVPPASRVWIDGQRRGGTVESIVAGKIGRHGANRDELEQPCQKRERGTRRCKPNTPAPATYPTNDTRPILILFLPPRSFPSILRAGSSAPEL